MAFPGFLLLGSMSSHKHLSSMARIQLLHSCPCNLRRMQPGAHPNAGEGLWGTAGEVPSFLYAMPLGGNRVFLEVGAPGPGVAGFGEGGMRQSSGDPSTLLDVPMPVQPSRSTLKQTTLFLPYMQETCLVAKPALPFAVLKRRLERRLKAMGIKVKEVG